MPAARQERRKQIIFNKACLASRAKVDAKARGTGKVKANAKAEVRAWVKAKGEADAKVTVKSNQYRSTGKKGRAKGKGRTEGHRT